MKPKLERTIERRCVGYALRFIPTCRKMNGAGHRDWPDYFFPFPGGVALFVEFKRPGEKLRIGQKRNRRILKALGFHVAVIDTFNQFVELFQIYYHDKSRSTRSDLSGETLQGMRRNRTVDRERSVRRVPPRI